MVHRTRRCRFRDRARGATRARSERSDRENRGCPIRSESCEASATQRRGGIRSRSRSSRALATPRTSVMVAIVCVRRQSCASLTGPAAARGTLARVDMSKAARVRAAFDPDRGVRRVGAGGRNTDSYWVTGNWPHRWRRLPNREEVSEAL